MKRIIRFIEYQTIVLLAKVLGIGIVVRYLRIGDPSIYAKLLRRFGASVGPNTRITAGLRIENVGDDPNCGPDFRRLRIGKNCYIGADAYLDLANEITIGDNVTISGQVSILTHGDCNRSPWVFERLPRVCQPVVIETESWVAFGATLMPGVTIRSKSVVAAAALVTRSTVAGHIFSGVPARPGRFIGDGTGATGDPSQTGRS